MPAERPSRLTEWISALREALPAVKIHLAAWIDACRGEPRLIWQTPAVRIITYVLLGVLGVKTISWGIGLWTPGGTEPVPIATTADFHVVCTNKACARHFVINRAFDFDDFPVRCPFCGKQTGYHARRCTSGTCHGAWVVPRNRDGRLTCPRCDGDLGPAP